MSPAEVYKQARAEHLRRLAEELGTVPNAVDALLSLGVIFGDRPVVRPPRCEYSDMGPVPMLSDIEP